MFISLNAILKRMSEMQNNDRIKLGDKSDVNPFRVPDGYFDTLPQRIMANVEVGKVETHKTGMIYVLRPLLGLAAVFGLVFLLVYVPLRTFSPGKQANEQASIFDMEYFISYSTDDHSVFEALNSDDNESLDQDQLEKVLMASLNEYELFVLNSNE